MIRRLRLKLAEWGYGGTIEDPQGEFDDYRRRLQQESATLRRMARNRLREWLRQKRKARQVAA